MAPDLRRSFIRRTASFRKKKSLEASLKAEKIKDLNDEDKAKFVEFKKCVYDDLQDCHSDIILLRFLKARNFEIGEAEKLFRLDSNYRRFWDVGTMLDNYVIPEVNRKYHISGIIGYDKEGSLIRVLNMGNADLKGIVHSLSSLEQLRIFVWCMEHDTKLMTEENKKTGRNADKYLYIINLENLSLNQLTYKPVLDSAMQGLKLLQDHFYDIAKAIYIVNAPPFFSTALKLFKPVIQDSFHKTLKVLSENWREELLQHITADVLPVYLGGKRVDYNNDPNCKALIGSGGEIPECYYASNALFLDPDDPEVTTALIPAGSFLNFKYPVLEAGTDILWHVHAKENDIGVGIFFEPLPSGLETPRTRRKNKEEDMSKMEQIVPVIRSQCQLVPEVGKGTAVKPGIYVVHFDNTYSWMNSKHVYFKITVRPPHKRDLQNLEQNSLSFQNLTI